MKNVGKVKLLKVSNGKIDFKRSMAKSSFQIFVDWTWELDTSISIYNNISKRLPTWDTLRVR